MSAAAPTSTTTSEATTASIGGPMHMSLTLSREVTCIRSMAWRCDLPSNLNWEKLSQQLELSELTKMPAVRGLSRFVNAGGDEIVLVTASGRVQLRVHYTVPEHERRFAAERLFQVLVYALRRL
jgi:hypothetical protein